MKNHTLLFLAVILFLSQPWSASTSYAKAPDGPSKICWVMDIVTEDEINQNHYGVMTQEWLSSFVMIYDTRTGDYDKHEIPKEWQLVESNAADGCVYFIRESEMKWDRFDECYDLLSWREGEATLIYEGIRLPGCAKVLAYKHNTLYYMQSDFTEENQPMRRVVAVSFDGAHDLSFTKTTVYPLFEHVDKYNTMRVTVNENGELATSNDNGTFIIASEEQTIDKELFSEYVELSGAVWYAENQLLFWMSYPGDTRVEVFHGYQTDSTSRPTHKIARLMVFDMASNEYYPFLDEDGGMIELEDANINMETITTVYPEYDLMLIQHNFSNYSAFLTDVWEGLDSYRIVAITLSTGNSEVIYQAGVEPTDYEGLWKYIEKMYGEPFSDDEPYSPESRLTEREKSEYYELLFPDRINNGEQKGTVYRFAPYLPVIFY